MSYEIKCPHCKSSEFVGKNSATCFTVKSPGNGKYMHVINALYYAKSEQENRELREALEKIISGKGHDPIDDEDCTMGECDCNFRLAKAALAKSGDRHE